ncbi:MAG: hypothetical protein WC708_05030 [Lentisphaeria bacterium]
MKEEPPTLPKRFHDKVAAFPEYSMGVNRIKIDLANGQRIYDVFVAGSGVIVKIGNKQIEREEDLDFNTNDITAVMPEG